MIERLKLAKKEGKGSYKNLRNFFGISRSSFSYHAKPKLAKRVNSKKEAVRSFFQNVSMTLPDKKSSQRSGPQAILEEPIKDLYKQFKETENFSQPKFFFQTQTKVCKKDGCYYV